MGLVDGAAVDEFAHLQEGHEEAQHRPTYQRDASLLRRLDHRFRSSATLTAIGFSQKMCLPGLAAAARAISLCMKGGLADADCVNFTFA